MDVRTAGPDLVRSGPWSGIPDQFNFGPVRWSGIPDRVILVRSGGPGFRTKSNWSGPMVRNSGPINLGPVRWSGNPDQPIFGPVRNFFDIKIEEK